MTTELQNLLKQAKTIIKHYKKVEKIKGESFNVFSILKMETKENSTHSAFIAELLNPKGAHQKGTCFLDIFVQMILNKINDNEANLPLSEFDISTAKVIVEHSIGGRNDKLKTGGRIDIFIRDDNGYTICIENKINAVDQFAQIERYYKYNQQKNTVVYLNLDGSNPSKESKQNLEEEKDFCLISYQENIVKWLEHCQKESVDIPILRESIRQYIILIKKLTNQTINYEMETEIFQLIKNNYSEARTIKNNIEKVELKIVTEFLSELVTELKNELGSDWDIKKSSDISASWAGISLRYDKWPEKISIKLEGQSKIHKQQAIYGVIANKTNWDRKLIKTECSKLTALSNGFKESNTWPFFKPIFNFGHYSTFKKLLVQSDRNELIQKVSRKLIDLAIECKAPFENLKK